MVGRVGHGRGDTIGRGHDRRRPRKGAVLAEDHGRGGMDVACVRGPGWGLGRGYIVMRYTIKLEM